MKEANNWYLSMENMFIRNYNHIYKNIFQPQKNNKTNFRKIKKLPRLKIVGSFFQFSEGKTRIFGKIWLLYYTKSWPDRHFTYCPDWIIFRHQMWFSIGLLGYIMRKNKNPIPINNLICLKLSKILGKDFVLKTFELKLLKNFF